MPLARQQQMADLMRKGRSQHRIDGDGEFGRLLLDTAE